jgi:hypothetical protein
MDEFLLDLLSKHPQVISGIVFTLVGVIVGWFLGYWRRHRMKKQVAGGDIRELLIIEQILVKEQSDGRTTLRIRSLGSAPLTTVLTNPVAHDAFVRRSKATKPTNTLIDMQDKTGSYLLHLLQPWVCGMARIGPYAHDLWIMAPVCEPGQLSHFQSTTVVLIRQADLKRFLDWEFCKHIYVEHGSDGARVLTLWYMAREMEKQIADLKRLRAEGKPTKFVETMYQLDIGLDLEEYPLPTKPVPWLRFASILKDLGLNA